MLKRETQMIRDGLEPAVERRTAFAGMCGDNWVFLDFVIVCDFRRHLKWLGNPLLSGIHWDYGTLLSYAPFNIVNSDDKKEAIHFLRRGELVSFRHGKEHRLENILIKEE